jgi:biopolymer transport protein ExbD
MATINSEINDARKAGTRQKKTVPRIDMTPMVDLGFLLITFFVITAEMSKPVAVTLNMPKAGPPMTLGNANALTVLLTGGDRAWYYSGNWPEAVLKNDIAETNSRSPEGLRNMIIEKKKWLNASGFAEGSRGLMLLVKADEKANYRNIVDMLDEVMINDVRKYAIVKMEPGEMEWIKQKERSSE